MSIYEAYIVGDLDRAIELEVIKPAIIQYCKIYKQYRVERSNGLNYIQAVEAVADKLCCSEATVRRAVAIVI